MKAVYNSLLNSFSLMSKLICNTSKSNQTISSKPLCTIFLSRKRVCTAIIINPGLFTTGVYEIKVVSKSTRFFHLSVFSVCSVRILLKTVTFVWLIYFWVNLKVFILSVVKSQRKIICFWKQNQQISNKLYLIFHPKRIEKSWEKKSLKLLSKITLYISKTTTI